MKAVTVSAALLLCAWPGVVWGQQLDALSLEELTRVKVSLVSRKAESLSRAAGAVYVIGADEIRRSGLSSIPELLRRVPGLQVARVDASKWAVSARGFNGRFANKMLVMIDGRSIYNNVYSGTWWDQNETPLEDVERIEVIRGPGATMWGANAVNGVINIVTKSARKTEGSLAAVETGQDVRGSALARFGSSAGAHGSFRVFAKAQDVSSRLWADGAEGGDEWNSLRAGGRVDLQVSQTDSLMLQGELYRGRAPQTLNGNFPLPQVARLADPVRFGGGFAMGRWERKKEGSDWSAQLYYTDEDRTEWAGGGQMGTLDFDFQHHFALTSRHELIWGAGFRRNSDDLTTSLVSFTPQQSNSYLGSLFLQDDFALVPDRLTLSAGAKLQWNSYTGIEVQPDVRLAWTPGPRQTFWTAISRAARTPSRRDRDISLTYLISPPRGASQPLPIYGEMAGSPNFGSEYLRAHEAGFRRQLARGLSLDAAAFLNVYTGVQTYQVAAPKVVYSPSPRALVTSRYVNGMGGRTFGGEAALAWTPRSHFKLQLNYAWAQGRLRMTLPQAQVSAPDLGWQTPKHTAAALASFDLSRRWSVDSAVYYVSKVALRGVPGYFRGDARLAFKFGDGGEISGGVRNALQGSSAEIADTDYVIATQPRRNTVYVKLLVAF